MNKPLISVLCSSYNHEKFVSYFIKCLQKQTYTNWELIIIDDCSTDNNVFEIQNFLTDERIHFEKMSINSGSSIVTSKAFSISTGEIIIDFASDDGLEPTYFETVVKIFSENEKVGVVYNSLKIIDENNKVYDEWVTKSRDKISILRELFYDQNVLFSTGFAVKREFYEKLVPMNFACIQHQDYKWHIQLLSMTDCFILEKPLVQYRIQRKNSISLGTLSQSAINRVHLEENYLMNTFLSIKNPKMIEEIVLDPRFHNFDRSLIPFVLGMSVQKSKNIYKKQWGYQLLMDFFEEENNFTLINKLFDFDFHDFLNLSDSIFYNEKKERYIFVKKILKKLKKIFKRDL